MGNLQVMGQGCRNDCFDVSIKINVQEMFVPSCIWAVALWSARIAYFMLFVLTFLNVMSVVCFQVYSNHQSTHM